jgi:hypothetical protein
LEIYEFLKTLLKTEFKAIFQKMIPSDAINNKNKKRKIRKKTIITTDITDTTLVDNTNKKQHNVEFELIA